MRARPSVFLLWFWLAPLAPVWGGVTYLDLSAAANRGPTDPFDQSFPDAQDSVQKNGLASFPVGDRTFRGIPFRLLDPAKNDGRSFVALKGRERPDFPQAVTLKGPGGGVKDLYFLQTCHWGGTAPHITVAQYEVSYADGQGVTIPLHVGREFTNFWGADDTTESFLAWYYRYKNSTMGVNLFAWKNPRPGQAIQTVVFRSLSKMPVPLLFAVTASSEDLPVSPVSPKPEPTAVTDTQGWAAPASGDPSAPPAVDLSGFLDAPAGKHGPVTVKAGSLVFADGTGARFWGTRLLPGVLSMDGAALGDLAARLAADGFNLAEVDLPEGDAPTDAATPAPGPPAGLEALLGALKAKGVYLLVKAPEGSSEGASLDDPAVLPEGIFSVLEAAYNPVPTGAPAPVALQNGPQLLGLADSLPAQLILGRAFGKPALARWSEAWPQSYLAETPLLMASTAAFQGFAACVGESLEAGAPAPALSPGTDWANPLLGPQEPAAALCFLRGDLKQGRTYSWPEGLDDSASAALTALAHCSGRGVSTDPLGATQAKVRPSLKSFTSDSGQIQWQGNIGLYQVDSPRFQAAVGFFSHRRVGESGFEFETSNWFGSFSVVSLTDKPIIYSDHLLLAAATRAENTGMVYDQGLDKVMDLGGPPVLVEPFQAQVVIFRTRKDPALRIRALDAWRRPLKLSVPFAWKGDNLSFYWIPKASYLEVYKQPAK